MTTYELTRCPVCDSLESVEIADTEAIRSEVESLWEFHDRRLRSDIPPAHLTDRVVFSQYPPLRLSQCRQCSHVYRNPWERREALGKAYDGTAPDDGVLEALFETQRAAFSEQVGRLTAVAGGSGRGLEIGSYVGGFLAAARDAGWRFTGVDVSEGATAFAARKGLTVRRGEITDIAGDTLFDAVAVWNTFEQLYDTRAAVLAARRLVRPGGVLAVRVPNGAFYVDWRQRLRGPLGGVAIRLLAHNNLLTFPYRQGFTAGSLTTLLAKGQFQMICAIGDTLVPIADQWTTRYGRIEERVVKRLQRLGQRGWNAPWVEAYARAV